MKLKTLLLTAALAGCGFSAASNAAFIPVGPQTSVSTATVAGWGWSVCYTAGYDKSGDSVAHILKGCPGSHLMLAAKLTNGNTYDVLAAADFADVTFDTGNSNTPHIANGTEWYFSDNWSWGFAGLGDTLNRISCDTYDAWTLGVPEGDRLCWHTNAGVMNGGWRSGVNTSIWGSDWSKVILTDALVPEPMTIALFGAGLAGVARLRRRKQTA